MCKLTKNKLFKIKEKLPFFKNSNKESKSINSPYTALTPTSDAQECEVYLEALSWALKQKTIKNIAITGSYGSGKSSVIQTFIKQNTFNYFNQYKFFNISLAAFKDFREQEDGKNELNDQDLQRLIEMSILQQIMAHEKDYKLPESRLKKITVHSRKYLIFCSILICIFALSFAVIFFPNILKKILHSSINEIFGKYTSFFEITTRIVVSIGFVSIIYKILKMFTRLSTIKFNIHNAEIEFNNEAYKSVLNQHLEEIIYFFQMTKYNVVIIEDLDRFAQSEIFTKLREINLLLNNSKKIKRDIVFIYAIKDDMFLDKERTKFFDFMIPIIPVINFSNSGEKLRGICKNLDLKVKDELIDDLCIFIEDMRLLYNIVNELSIYSKKLGKNLDINKLFAMIIYKNVYPNDFTKLNENSGILFTFIGKKREIIKNELKKIDEEISTRKKEIQIAEKHIIQDIRELRKLYLFQIIEQILENDSYGLAYFYINNEKKNITDIINDHKLFQYIQKPENDEIKYYNQYGTKSYNYKFIDIEKKVDQNRSYEEREKLISQETKNQLIQEINKLNNDKEKIVKYKLKDLVKNNLLDISFDKNSSEKEKNNEINIIIKQRDLILNLLRNGYIDENYLDYISIFHEGSLTRSDYQFLLKVKNNETEQFDYHLFKTDTLLKKIDINLFENTSVLNFDLVEKVLCSNNFLEKKEKLFKQLANESDESFNFINQFTDTTANIEIFIDKLCGYWSNIWMYLEKRRKTGEMEKYFKLIIQYAKIDDIKKIFLGSTSYINSYADFLTIDRDTDELKEIIQLLKLKFTNIDMNSNHDLLDFIFQNNYYDLNFNMINNCIQLHGSESKNILNNNHYTSIRCSNIESLNKYIEEHIEYYVNNVLLKLESNTNEQEEYYIELLNNTKISTGTKEKLVSRINTIVGDLNKINETDIQLLLLSKNKISPTWKNILLIYNNSDKEFSESLIKHLNDIDNAKELSKIKMTIDKNEKGESIYSGLCREIVNSDRLNIDVFELLIKSVPWCYNSFKTENLSENKIIALIKNWKICRKVEAFQYLSENFKQTNILLLEQDFSEFKDKIQELDIDADDLERILLSNKINKSSKLDIINNIDINLILQKQKSTQLIADFLIEGLSWQQDNNLKQLLLQSSFLDDKTKILLFSNNFEITDINSITSFLNSLIDTPYHLITNKNKKPVLKDNDYNRALLKKLKKHEYISSFSQTEQGLRIYHFKKNKSK